MIHIGGRRSSQSEYILRQTAELLLMGNLVTLATCDPRGAVAQLIQILDRFGAGDHVQLFLGLKLVDMREAIDAQSAGG